MMGIGFAEFLVIGVVALLVFGPDRLPDFAKQAGRMVRQVRTMSKQARDDIRSELGPEYADFELTDLDPRRAMARACSISATQPSAAACGRNSSTSSSISAGSGTRTRLPKSASSASTP